MKTIKSTLFHTRTHNPVNWNKGMWQLNCASKFSLSIWLIHVASNKCTYLGPEYILTLNLHIDLNVWFLFLTWCIDYMQLAAISSSGKGNCKSTLFSFCVSIHSLSLSFNSPFHILFHLPLSPRTCQKYFDTYLQLPSEEI